MLFIFALLVSFSQLCRCAVGCCFSFFSPSSCHKLPFQWPVSVAPPSFQINKAFRFSRDPTPHWFTDCQPSTNHSIPVSTYNSSLRLPHLFFYHHVPLHLTSFRLLFAFLLPLPLILFPIHCHTVLSASIFLCSFLWLSDFIPFWFSYFPFLCYLRSCPISLSPISPFPHSSFLNAIFFSFSFLSSLMSPLFLSVCFIPVPPEAAAGERPATEQRGASAAWRGHHQNVQAPPASTAHGHTAYCRYARTRTHTYTYTHTRTEHLCRDSTPPSLQTPSDASAPLSGAQVLFCNYLCHYLEITLI